MNVLLVFVIWLFCLLMEESQLLSIVVIKYLSEKVFSFPRIAQTLLLLHIMYSQSLPTQYTSSWTPGKQINSKANHTYQSCLTCHKICVPISLLVRFIPARRPDFALLQLDTNSGLQIYKNTQHPAMEEVWGPNHSSCSVFYGTFLPWFMVRSFTTVCSEHVSSSSIA